VVFRVRALNTVGYVYGEIGDLTEAMSWNQKGLEATIAAHAPVPEVEMNARLNLAENLLALGRTDEAEEQLRVVEVVVRHPPSGRDVMRWRYGQRFLYDLGEYRLAQGDPAEALSLADECLAWAERSDSRKNIAKARRLKGLALRATGHLDEADAELRAGLELAEAVGSPPQIWRTWVALGDVREAQGRADEAREAFERAVAVVDDVASGLTDEHRQTFLAWDHVRDIRVRAERAGSTAPP
jgi:tetratricopeptide (TPR) repeat protein